MGIWFDVMAKPKAIRLRSRLISIGIEVRAKWISIEVKCKAKDMNRSGSQGYD